ncbi:MAG: pirin family protein [Erythrobacter sp.]|jgi:quercetin 2,3-dioxygenase|uniref:pirin family protein n=1 Tax=Qipengyuania TaxID=1855416 RepID=UPI001A582B88|nr:pirin family protein [Qipengyuania citrea]MBL4717546.1 pirin family protein [Erythrobacter sp.]MCP2016376.1 redox-sensitive bicupin YhaK (pirin superfamily) [Qipengyuania citrea]MDE0900444.1 pirin family protein [Erythrobacter sp.]
MIDIRPFATLGHADHGWLDARHHFSFANYHDPDRMGWGSIRVWNDDTIAAQSGFPPHPHRDMEIVTFVRSGAITHRDSLGNEGRTAAGDVQVMSAGTGITHAEMNREDEATTLFQIWIIPDRQGEQPGWGQREFPKATREGGFEVLASGDAEADDALPIRTDAKVAAATLAKGQSAVWNTSGQRHQYLVAPKGRVTVNGHEAQPRDGIAVTGESEIVVEALDDAEIVLVDAR